MSEAKPDRKRAANILAAFALALTDKVEHGLSAVGGRSAMSSAALIQIGFAPGVSIETLRTVIGLSHSATVRVVDQLERDGLAKRVRGAVKDSRVAALSLTDEGERAMRRELASRGAVTERLIERLSDGEIETMLGLLAKAAPALVATEVEEEIACRLCDLSVCPQDSCPISGCSGAA